MSRDRRLDLWCALVSGRLMLRDSCCNLGRERGGEGDDSTWSWLSLSQTQTLQYIAGRHHLHSVLQ